MVNLNHDQKVDLIIDKLAHTIYEWVDLSCFTKSLDHGYHLMKEDDKHTICGIELPHKDEQDALSIEVWEINSYGTFIAEEHCHECLSLIEDNYERYGFDNFNLKARSEIQREELSIGKMKD